MLDSFYQDFRHSPSARVCVATWILEARQRAMFRKIFLYGTAGTAGFYATTRAYFKTTMGVCHSKRDLTGRTVIVTGANTGIGLETARDLASRNARVILACRDMVKGEAAKQEIETTTGNHDLVVKELDLSSFQSVRAFAKDIQNTEQRVDVLVNNAGVMGQPQENKSVDGLNMFMATNHHGPFLLTNLLLPKLKDSSPSIIVVVSSLAHEWAKEILANDDKEQAKKEWKCSKIRSIAEYGSSKLANVLFTRKLSENLKDTGVTVNALHPGAVTTALGRHLIGSPQWMITRLIKPMFKDPKQGAQTSIFVAVAEELEDVSGKYFSDCKEKKLKEHAMDTKAAKELWEYSEKVTGLTSSVQ